MITEEEKKEILRKYRKGNAILFTPDSPMLLSLTLNLESSVKRSVVLWAFDTAEEACSRFEQLCPGQDIPRKCVAVCRLWARGEVKIQEGRRAILACHALAKGMEEKEGIALVHAIAQACSSVHAQRHAVAFPLYRLTAMIRRCGPEKIWSSLEAYVDHMSERLTYWQLNSDDPQLVWAPFLKRED